MAIADPMDISSPNAGQYVELGADGALRLDSGTELRRFGVAYQTYGTLNAEKSNAVLVCHALTGDQHAANAHPLTGKPGWWDIMIGPGRPLDTNRYFIISTNVLGGCMGSTGPKEINPDTGEVWGLSFPVITIGDMVRAQARLLDHLGIERAAILGTSRGGLIAMVIAATAKDRLTGVALNDIGPELMAEGLADIDAYLGRRPKAQTFEEAAAMRASLMPGFEGVPHSRWAEEVRIHYTNTADGLNINYDPALRDAVAAAAMQPAPDLWPLFAALDGLPLALIRGKNSNLLSTETAKKMRTLRPDLIYADVPGRGHVPFLDEPEALAVLHEWRTHLP